MSTPTVGDVAPDVALPDDTGEIRRLADERGRFVVLYFYPKADTPGCVVEACAFRDANADIAAEGAVVWGVSPDESKATGDFRDKFSLSFPLLSDVDHAVAEAYGTWVEKTKDGRTYMGVARVTFLIGPDGTIVRVWPAVKPEGHAEEVLAAIRDARAGA
jgi:thioredoxin-dependent peroxiredoxin